MKKLSFVVSVLVASVALLSTVPVYAAYPEKPVQVIVPFSPGGGNDILIRLVGKYISSALGESIVVENKPGAGGQIGWTALAKSRPDGYTVGATSLPSMILVKALRNNVPFNLDDFTYVCTIQVDPLIWVVNKDSKFKSGREVLDFAKQNPGKLNVAGDGPQSNVQLQHLLTESKLGMKSNFIPYSGSGPALTALMGDQVDIVVSTLSAAKPHIDSGRLFPLVVFYNEPLPGVTFKTAKDEFGIDIPSVGTALRGVAVPGKVAPERVAILEKAFEAVTKNPEFIKQAESLGLIIRFTGSEESGKAVKEAAKIVEEYKDLF